MEYSCVGCAKKFDGTQDLELHQLMDHKIAVKNLKSIGGQSVVETTKPQTFIEKLRSSFVRTKDITAVPNFQVQYNNYCSSARCMTSANATRNVPISTINK